MLRQEPVKMPDTKRAPDYLNPDGTPVGSEQKPSAEVQQTLTTFSEDNGLSAAEKIPALKAYIETHLDEPGIEKLIDLLETLAKEANDEETLKWVEEIRKKLAEKNSKPDNQGDSGGTNQVRGGPGVMISRLNFESKDNPLNNLFPSPPVLLRDNKTLPVFLESLLSPYKNNYDLLIVGAVVSVIPIVILFAMFQRHFISGMTAGGVKG